MNKDVDNTKAWEDTGVWVDKEFASIKFPDKRLDKRFNLLAKQLAHQSQASINQACGTWSDTKAAYRFFANDQVQAEAILAPHVERTLERAEKEDIVLAIQDTCYLSYGHHPKTKGLCTIGGKNVVGLVMHSTLLTTVDGKPLGLLHQKIWSRETVEDDAQRSKKETYKWIEGLKGEKANAQQQIITVADREADIFEFMHAHEELGRAFVIRAQSDRAINKASPYSKVEEKLWSHMEKQAVGARIEVDVAKKKKKTGVEKKRKAQLSVSWSEVTLQPPRGKTKNAQGEDLGAIKVRVVYAQEKNPPTGVTALEWMLLTSLEVTKEEEAQTVLNYYKQRWGIEEFHKILKSGCKIEDCRLESHDRLSKYVTLMSVTAWRIHYMTHMSRGEKGKDSCTELLFDHEWKALYIKIHKTHELPTVPPTIDEVMRWIARLGGFLNRKNDKEPGITVLWRGLMRLNEIKEDYLLFMGLNTCG